MPQFLKCTALVQWLESAGFIGNEQAELLRTVYQHRPVEELLTHLENCDDQDNHTVKILSATQRKCIEQGTHGSLIVADPDDLRKVRFLIRDWLNPTGQGSVAIAQDLQPTNRPLVALKRMPIEPLAADDDHMRKRAYREVESYAEIGDHPNIARYHAHFEDNNSHLVVITEYVEGATLEDTVHDRMSREGVTVVQTLSWLEETLEGLATVHANAIIHRDLKPRNVLFERSTGSLKIVDFGFSKRLHPVNETHTELTLANSKIGTYAWMPPEQFVDARLAEAGSDVFSFGCVAWFMLFGVPPCYPDFGFGPGDYQSAQTALQPVLDRRNSVRSDIPPQLIAFLQKFSKMSRISGLSPSHRERIADTVAVRGACFR